MKRKLTLNPQLVVFKKIKINSEFLYFLFTTSYIQKIIELDIIGGAAGTLSQQKTKQFLFSILTIQNNVKLSE